MEKVIEMPFLAPDFPWNDEKEGSEEPCPNPEGSSAKGLQIPSRVAALMATVYVGGLIALYSAIPALESYICFP